MTPSYPRDLVKRLAAGTDSFEMYRIAADDALGFGLDSDDVKEIFQRIEQWQCIASKPTVRHFPGTMSDYYVFFVEECLTRMFIKFLIFQDRLVVTSFKEDDGNA
ncbi:MAG: hypothetical protein GC191_16610 [Azospirillum sp.]|nr:hypothetical protein [Azospirillum sp.]